jgi:hypothetical protein
MPPARWSTRATITAPPDEIDANPISDFGMITFIDADLLRTVSANAGWHLAALGLSQAKLYQPIVSAFPISFCDGPLQTRYPHATRLPSVAH